jgi:hypothetical protein
MQSNIPMNYNGFNGMSLPINGVPMNGTMNGMPIVNPLIGVTGTNQIPLLSVWQNGDAKISNNLGFQMNPVSSKRNKK